MRQGNVIPLKITTEYSLLKSLIKIDELINFLVCNNISICGICDDNLNGLMEFYLKCKKNNIKPIIGLDVVINDMHVYLYAKNYKGYQALLKIDYLKNNLTIESLYDENIYIVLPFSSNELYEEIKIKDNVFISYENEIEKKNALLLTDKILYINNIRCLKKEDVTFLKYLKLLNNSFMYSENSYYKNSNEEDTKILASFCNSIDIEIPFNKRYIPKFNTENSEKYLNNLAFLGLKKRLDGKENDIYLKRLNYELNIINKMGFVDYFLIVYDYVLYAKKNGVLVGPGRGSAAGSLVSYALGITNIDPIKYGLLFERFLNINRKKMPDIDIDFESEKRPFMIEYVKNKYGFDKVAVGLTFNNYKSKLVLRDLAKIMNIDSDLFEKFIKNIDSSKSLKENLENERVKKYIELYADIKNLYNIAFHLENLKKNTSTHAAGVIISSVKLGTIIPISNESGLLKTGIEMTYLEDMGLLKMDFLALEKLSIISGVLKKIGNLNIDKISLDDTKTIDIFKYANTDDIFQFESKYAKDVLEKLKISSFNELIIALALVRPGANKQIDEYLKNKNNKNLIINSKLDSILRETYGTIIYQEQVMKIFEVMGYSLFEADEIRSAMSKKRDELINKEHDKFIDGAIKNGFTLDFAENLFSRIKEFGGYGFNKSHSTSYAMLSYQMAYLKANYLKEFTFYLLENNKDIQKCERMLNDLKNAHYKILKPNINVSKNTFISKNEYILLPLNIVKGINNDIAEKIILKREDGFKDIYDFFFKCSDFINKEIYTSLVKSSSLKVFGYNKKTLINNYDLLYNYAQLDDVNLSKPLIKQAPEYDENILRTFELESYGFYITNHPCSTYKNTIKVNDIAKYLFKNIDMVLLINKIKVINDKNNKQMAFLDCEDETGKVEATIFNDAFKNSSDINVGDVIFINVKVVKRFDKIKIIINNIKRK